MSHRTPETPIALRRLHAAAAGLGRQFAFMEVCGTHTMSAFRCGLHGLMPANVRLLSGPGCPVCVTAQGDIDLLIELACDRDVVLCTYGDMLRVPGRRGSLERVRSGGGRIHVVYSSLDAVRLAQANPADQVVFGAVGFETTAPATAAALRAAQRLDLANFSVLASHKAVVPAMLALLDGAGVGLDGFLCPGHVSVIIGSEAYRPIVEKHRLPCVIAGFEPLLMVDALARLVELASAGRAELVNAYPEAVSAAGNPVARRLLAEFFEPADVRWRGLGVIPDSGLALRAHLARYDARRRFDLAPAADQEHPGCRCGAVLTGMVSPHDCPQFGTACTPLNPLGPCMVSSEGTCQAWFKYHRGPADSPRRRPVAVEVAP